MKRKPLPFYRHNRGSILWIFESIGLFLNNILNTQATMKKSHVKPPFTMNQVYWFIVAVVVGTICFNVWWGHNTQQFIQNLPH